MSAPVATPAPPAPAAPPEARPIVPRLLGVGACVAVGFVAIWQGFGAAGYGTDAHTKRVGWACFQLLGFGVALVCVKGWFSVRALVALAFFASACGAWWTVRSSGGEGVSLREAVARRDELRAALATPGIADPGHTLGTALQFQTLQAHYPSLLDPLRADYTRWAEAGVAALRKRYRETAPDDIKGVITLRVYAVGLDEASPGTFALFMTDEREWCERAVKAKVVELVQAQGDWDAFDRTAPGRKALAEAFPETRAELVAAEEEWGVTALGFVRLRTAGGERVKADWRGLEKSLLARQSLDTSDGRLKRARGELLAFAHDEARSEVTAHLDAGRYDAAFGLARTHAVEWNATAAMLGEKETKKLDALREHCEALAKLFDASAKPADPADIAPPPRAKP